MFNRASSFAIVLALPLLATATAVPRNDPPPQCNTGSIQCCNSVQSKTAPGISTLLGLFGLVLPNVGTLVGLTCSPFTGVGVGGTSCSTQTVCCTNNYFSGLINLGCSPINLNL